MYTILLLAFFSIVGTILAPWVFLALGPGKDE